MNFNSQLFLFYFLPLWAAAYALAPARWRNPIALAASLLFYAWGAPEFIFLVIASAALDWVIGRWLVAPEWQARRRWLLIIGIAANVAILLVAKYTNFAVDAASSLSVLLGGRRFSIMEIALPIGVSFIVFEKISYLVDIWRGEGRPTKTFGGYLLYVFLFPKMLAGPIIRYHTIADQLERRDNSRDDWKAGAIRFIAGLSKKVLIADTLAPTANAAFAADPGSIDASTAWIGLICFTLQIYFDFSGYSDMAIGMCRMMGIRIQENFNTPYISQSFTEFWHRWHISLSTWIRDYLYIPLGGNRHGALRLYLNLWICFLISGLWHGANWTFLFWGAYHGMMLVLERLFLLDVQKRLPRLVNIAMTLLLVMIGWVLFRAQSLGGALDYMAALGRFGVPTAIPVPEKPIIAMMAVGAFLSLAPALVPLERLTRLVNHRYAEPIVLIGSTGLLLLSVSQVVATDFVAFLYFRF